MVLGGLGSDLGMELSIQSCATCLGSVLADFGHTRIVENLGHMAQPRWCQDGPSWALDGHLETTSGVMLAVLEVIFAKLVEV